LALVVDEATRHAVKNGEVCGVLLLKKVKARFICIHTLTP